MQIKNASVAFFIVECDLWSRCSAAKPRFSALLLSELRSV